MVLPRGQPSVSALCPVSARLRPFLPTSHPCLLLTLMHAPSQHWSRRSGHLTHPCPPSRPTHRSKCPKQGGHSTSEDALSQPEGEEHLPQRRSLLGFSQRTAGRLCYRLIWASLQGPRSDVKHQRQGWHKAPGSRSRHRGATEGATFFPRLPPAAKRYKTTPNPAPPHAPPWHVAKHGTVAHVSGER